MDKTPDSPGYCDLEHQHRELPVAESTVQDTALLMVLRFFGGMVLAIILPLLLVVFAMILNVPYGYGLETGIFDLIIMLIAVPAGGIYAARHLQEAKIAERRLPLSIRFVLGCLSILLRFCGGCVLASLACIPLAMLVENRSMYAEGPLLETGLTIAA